MKRICIKFYDGKEWIRIWTLSQLTDIIGSRYDDLDDFLEHLVGKDGAQRCWDLTSENDGVREDGEMAALKRKVAGLEDRLEAVEMRLGKGSRSLPD